jgi:hypothetical protein
LQKAQNQSNKWSTYFFVLTRKKELKYNIVNYNYENYQYINLLASIIILIEYLKVILD